MSDLRTSRPKHPAAGWEFVNLFFLSPARPLLLPTRKVEVEVTNVNDCRKSQVPAFRCKLRSTVRTSARRRRDALVALARMTPLHVGFTGTQTGMTGPQQTRAYRLLLALKATDLHHGDCIGADDQIDQIGRELGLTIYIHPPTNPSKRAWCTARPIGETWTEYPAQPYLAAIRRSSTWRAC